MKALITGARSGIGKRIGLDLEQLGYDVILGVHTEEELLSLKEKLKKMNSNIKCIKLDITNEEDRLKIRDMDIDILINNASVCYGGSLININPKLVQENFNVNVIGTLRLTQIFLGDLFVKGKKGTVIFISSLASILPIPYTGAYAISKAAINMMAKILRKEIKQIGMDVSIKLIQPGIYNTGFNDYMFDFLNNEKSLKMKKMFNLLGNNKLKPVSNTIIKSINSKRLIYRTNIFDSIIVKIYNLLFS